jgi:hypothetical protein
VRSCYRRVEVYWRRYSRLKSPRSHKGRRNRFEIAPHPIPASHLSFSPQVRASAINPYYLSGNPAGIRCQKNIDNCRNIVWLSFWQERKTPHQWFQP